MRKEQHEKSMLNQTRLIFLVEGKKEKLRKIITIPRKMKKKKSLNHGSKNIKQKQQNKYINNIGRKDEENFSREIKITLNRRQTSEEKNKRERK